jgi:hypothetical protein
MIQMCNNALLNISFIMKYMNIYGAKGIYASKMSKM